MVHQSSHFGSARYVVIGRKYSSCKPNAVGKADRMNSVGPATIMNSANPIMSQTLISLTTRMPFNPTRQDVVYMAVTRMMVMDCVVRSFGRPHGVQRIADLQAQEADRADRARDHRDDAGGVDQAADRPLERALAQQRIQQRARRQRQALVVVQVHQHDGQQAAKHGPGQEAQCTKDCASATCAAISVFGCTWANRGGGLAKCIKGSAAARTRRRPPAART